MKMLWRCRCGKRVEKLTDDNFGGCGCPDPVYGPEYFYMTTDCADMLDEMDKDYSDQAKQLAEARAEIERLKAPAHARDLREKLAELCHSQWAGWMEYLFYKSKQVDGCVIIPAWANDRWRRQIATKYSDLSESEKDSDRNEADRFLSLLAAEIERKDALIEQMREALNVLVASATPSGPLWHGSAEMQIARAAISAAGRSEG